MLNLPPLESLRFFEAAAGERHGRRPRRLRIVSVEAVAEKWLMPRLPGFTAAHPGIAIEIETNHRGVDPERRDFDAWLAYSGETGAGSGPAHDNPVAGHNPEGSSPAQGAVQP